MKFILNRILRMMMAVFLSVVIFYFASNFIEIGPIGNWENFQNNMLVGIAEFILAAAIFYLVEVFARKK